jgi:hypothetical protein
MEKLTTENLAGQGEPKTMVGGICCPHCVKEGLYEDPRGEEVEMTSSLLSAPSSPGNSEAGSELSQKDIDDAAILEKGGFFKGVDYTSLRVANNLVEKMVKENVAYAQEHREVYADTSIDEDVLEYELPNSDFYMPVQAKRSLGSQEPEIYDKIDEPRIEFQEVEGTPDFDAAFNVLVGFDPVRLPQSDPEATPADDIELSTGWDAEGSDFDYSLDFDYEFINDFEIDLNVADDDMDVDGEPKKFRGKRMDATLDSGAGASVMNPKHAPGYKVEPSPGSIAGQRYVGPGGERIPNEGQLQVGIQLMDAKDKHACFQAAQVRKTLLAVSGVCDKEQFCFFDNDGSWICNRNSPEAIAIRKLIAAMKNKIGVERKGGIYVLPMWLKPAPSKETVFHRQE